MNRSLFFHYPLFERIRYLEWFFLAAATIMGFMFWRFGPPSPAQVDPALLLMIMLCLVVLSLRATIDSSYNKRLAYTIAEIIVLTIAAAAGAPRFIAPLYMTTVAKACLLLNRKGLVLTVVLAYISQIIVSSYKTSLEHAGLLEHGLNVNVVTTLVLGGIILTFGQGLMMVLVTMLIGALVTAEKHKLQAEQLVKEVEVLATRLERARIARDIHDSLGHTLTSLKIQLEVASKYHDVDHAQSLAALTQSQELATKSLADVRHALFAIRNVDFNLQESVEALIQEVRLNRDLQIDLTLDLPADLASETAYQLYRIIQESLTNTLKHAEASEITIALNQDAGNIELNVSDNGKGFEIKLDDGFGLRGIRERVGNMHGTVTFAGSPDRGMHIRVVIPKQLAYNDSGSTVS